MVIRFIEYTKRTIHSALVSSVWRQFAVSIDPQVHSERGLGQEEAERNNSSLSGPGLIAWLMRHSPQLANRPVSSGTGPESFPTSGWPRLFALSLHAFPRKPKFHLERCIGTSKPGWS